MKRTVRIAQGSIIYDYTEVQYSVRNVVRLVFAVREIGFVKHIDLDNITREGSSSIVLDGSVSLQKLEEEINKRNVDTVSVFVKMQDETVVIAVNFTKDVCTVLLRYGSKINIKEIEKIL